jgi:hypothetical protein
VFRRLLSSLTVPLFFCLTLVAGAAAAAPGPPSDARASQFRSVDADFVRMGHEIPGFGGLFYDEQGRPTVYLLDPEGARKIALKSLGTEARIQQGDYEFERLLGWRVELRPVLALPGVVFLDVDETKNRVVIGIDSSSKSLDRERLEQKLLATSVPRQAVLLQETARISPLIGLQDKLRPVPGGVQVVFSGFACTLGFNAVRAGVFGFVVASHCTDTFGQVEGTRFFQSSGDAIGTEIADPGLFTDPPCPPGMGCRYSDTAFAKYDKASLGALAKIARPSSNGSESGPLTLKTPTARFTIKSRMSSPLVGETVHKVGRTTGWTYGNVINTCVDVNEDVNVTLLCQSMVQIGGGPGDSGAPVFVALPGNNARLVGLLWGGGDDPVLGIVGVFSPLENIEMDLGPLKTN